MYPCDLGLLYMEQSFEGVTNSSERKNLEQLLIMEAGFLLFTMYQMYKNFERLANNSLERSLKLSTQN